MQHCAMILTKQTAGGERSKNMEDERQEQREEERWVVRDLDSPDEPILGRLVVVEEDTVLYEDTRGRARQAPYDRVKLEREQPPLPELSPERRFRLYVRLARILREAGADRAADEALRIASGAASESKLIKSELVVLLARAEEQGKL